jgi:surface antigen
VVALGERARGRRSLYSGTASLRLCRRSYRRARDFVPGLALAAALTCALSLGGCAFQMASLVSRDDTDSPTTGSLGQAPGQVVRVADASQPAQRDLAYARAAASDALARGGKDASVPWENPQTGAGGNITPLATAYSEGGSPCRDFLASYVHGGAQDWLQGAACRDRRGVWEIRRLKALKPS